VTDQQGASSETFLEIKAGNEAPQVQLDWKGNRSFYFGKEEITYALNVTDQEDGAPQESKIGFSIDYLSGGFDLIQAGHQEEKPILPGESYITQAGCKACHAVEKASVGPTYTAVSQKYLNQPDAKSYLINKITQGGGGIWGERVMPGHSHLAPSQVESMVDYILSLANPNAVQRTLPLAGTFPIDQTENPEGYYLIQANYEDKGASGIEPLKTQLRMILRNSLVSAVSANVFEGVAKANGPSSQWVKFTAARSWIRFDQLDLTGIKQLEIALSPGNTSGKLEIRTGSADGTVIGETKILSKADRPANWEGQFFPVPVTLSPTDGINDVFLVFVPDKEVSIWNTFNVSTIKFKR
jgi:cytochrome c